MPAIRPPWPDLPTGLRTRVAELLDAPVDQVHGDSQDGGFTPAAALRVHTRSRHTGRAGGRAGGNGLFVKAIPADHPLAAAYETEAHTLAELPAAALAAELVWCGTVDGWIVMVLTDVPGRHPDLGIGSPDIPVVVDAVAAMSRALNPSPLVDAAPVTVPRGWRDLTTDQLETEPTAWAISRLGELAALEERWAAQAAGTALVHNDIRPDNLLLTPDSNGAGNGDRRHTRVTVVDWAQARLGRPWRDTASLVPHLIMAGHTPRQAEAHLMGTELATTDPELVTANAAALAGYLIKSAPLPPPPNVPHLRAYQARAAQAVSAWVRHRTGW
jgi:aminoglycoside phosphotransferase (APT) family kinase protein